VAAAFQCFQWLNLMALTRRDAGLNVRCLDNSGALAYPCDVADRLTIGVRSGDACREWAAGSRED